MENFLKEERYCVICNKLLVNNQRKYCSKECEIKDRKGKKIGSYDKSRVDAMAVAKKKVYEERYLNKFKPLLEEYLSYNYINNIPQLASHINMPLVNAKKYFKYYPDKKKLLYSTPSLPKNIQDLSPDKYFDFKEKILDENLTSEKILNIKNEYSLSDNLIVKTFKALRPNDAAELLKRFNFISDKGTKALKSHSVYSSLEEKIEKSTSNIYKYHQIKKLFERDHIEDLFKETLYFTKREEYKDYLKLVSSHYKCVWKLLVRYLNEKGIKPEINYKILLRRKHYLEKMNISEEFLENILEEFKKFNSYGELRIFYKEVYENFFKKIYESLYKKKSSQYAEFILDIEDLDTTGYLKKLKKEFYSLKGKTESYLILKNGEDFVEILKNDIYEIKSPDDYLLFENKYKNSVCLINPSFKKFAQGINSQYIKICDLARSNGLSKFGGSSIERIIINYLNSKNAKFKTQYKIKGDNVYSVYKVDIVINNKAIEIQGNYWHGSPLFYRLSDKQSSFLENSIFPDFKYDYDFNKKKKDLNEKQIRTLEKDIRKKEKLIEFFGKDNLYYIWEYDIENHFEKVKEFLDKLI